MTDTNIFQQIFKKIAPKLGENSQKTFDFLLPDIRQKYPTFWVSEPNLLKQSIKFGVKRAEYPTKYPTFWVPETDFLKFPPYPNPTFYYPNYSIPDFLLPAPALLRGLWNVGKSNCFNHL